MSSPRRPDPDHRAAPDVTHVVVGFSRGVLTDLDELLPAGAVLVLEEPDIIEARGALQKAKAHPCVAGIMAAATQDEPHAERLTELLQRPTRVQAVIPAVEYGVVGAAVLAHAWGLPGAGPTAARTLRDKIAMRVAAGAGGLAQPRWMIAETVHDVDELRDRYGGRCVLKPADRQASLGVRVLDRDDDAVEAWQHCTHADEPMVRSRSALPGRYLVEQRLDGPEVSVEALVHCGRIGFTNITAKAVQPGLSPVEMGHVVPAGLAPEVEAALAACVQELVRLTDFRSGVLHSEWILVEGCRPHFVECAARLPGDSIDLLIDLAYGGRFTEDYLAILEGRGPIAPRPKRRAAAIRFLTAPTGKVREITGRELASALPGVQEVTLSAASGAPTAPGATIAPVTSSWSRPGHVIATGADHREAARRAAQAASLIKFEMDEEMAWP
jgi:biotin carboxylase